MSLASCMHWVREAVAASWTKTAPGSPTRTQSRRPLELAQLEDRVLLSASPLPIPADEAGGELEDRTGAGGADESLASQGSDLATAIWFSGPRAQTHASPWDGTGFGVETPTAGGARWSILTGAEAPTRDEMILVGVDRLDGSIHGEIWDGAVWSVLPLNPLALSTSADHWGFAVEYEQQSGDAILVWNGGTSGGQRLYSSVWDGSSWSAATAIVTPGTAEPRHVQLAANPQNDELVLVVSDEANDDYALVWDGDQWGHAQVLDASGTGERDVEVVFEQQSGDALVVFGSGADANPHFRIWDGANWSGESVIAAPAGERLGPRWFSLAADPGTDRVLLGVATHGDAFRSDIWVSAWTGDAWLAPAIATTGLASSVDSPNVSVAFESQTGQGIATFAFERFGNNLAFMTWSETGGWSAPAPGLTLGGSPESLTLAPDPNSDQIMLLAQDGSRRLTSALWDGTRWASPEILETDTGNVHQQPFVFLWHGDSPSNLPPIAIAGGPYAVDEGASVPLDGSRSYNGDGVIATHEWDLDYDGSTFQVDAGGASPLFDATTLDGPSVRTIALRVTDERGATGLATTTVTVRNLPPAGDDVSVPVEDPGDPITDPLTPPSDSETPTVPTVPNMPNVLGISLGPADPLIGAAIRPIPTEPDDDSLRPPVLGPDLGVAIAVSIARGPGQTGPPEPEIRFDTWGGFREPFDPASSRSEERPETRVAAGARQLDALVHAIPVIEEAVVAVMPDNVAQPLVLYVGLIGEDLDSLGLELRTHAAAHSLLVGGAFGIAAALTAGYALWLLRGGQLLTSLIAQLPAWQLLDPLVILDRSRDDERDEPPDEVSVESLVDGAVRDVGRWARGNA